MTSDETRRRAAAHGVATSYLDWHGRRVEVSQRTLDAILDALGEPPGEIMAATAVRAEDETGTVLVAEGPVAEGPAVDRACS